MGILREIVEVLREAKSLQWKGAVRPTMVSGRRLQKIQNIYIDIEVFSMGTLCDVL